MYIYAFHLAFCTILPCVLHHFTLRFAPKRTAFSGILHCILHQNTLHLAAKRTLFCWKWPKNWYKQHSFEINIHFAAFTYYALFAPKTTFVRIDFLRQVGDWWTKKALRMLNFLLKTRHKKMIIPYKHVGQRNGKHVHLQAPRRAVVGHARRFHIIVYLVCDNNCSSNGSALFNPPSLTRAPQTCSNFFHPPVSIRCVIRCVRVVS